MSNVCNDSRANSFSVSRSGLAVKRQAGKQKDLGSIPLRFPFLFRKVVVCGHILTKFIVKFCELIRKGSIKQFMHT